MLISTSPATLPPVPRMYRPVGRRVRLTGLPRTLWGLSRRAAILAAAAFGARVLIMR